MNDKEHPMIGAHQTEEWLASLATALPKHITEPGFDDYVTRASLIGTIRYQLLPHITAGPGYNRRVDDNLRRALADFQRGRAADTIRWLGEAVAAAVATPQPSTYDQLAAENTRLRAAVQAVRDITPYCDLPVASGMLRVVRLTDIEKALALTDINGENR